MFENVDYTLEKRSHPKFPDKDIWVMRITTKLGDDWAKFKSWLSQNVKLYFRYYRNQSGFVFKSDPTEELNNLFSGAKKTATENKENSFPIGEYLTKLNDHHEAYYKERGHEKSLVSFYTTKGPKYVKIWMKQSNNSVSIFAFVDKKGNIYKPAGTNKPAGGVRGNINNENVPLTGGDLYADSEFQQKKESKSDLMANLLSLPRNMRIRKNYKYVDFIFSNIVEVSGYGSTGYTHESFDVEYDDIEVLAKEMLSDFQDFAKLTYKGDGWFHLHVHSNLFYDFRIGNKEEEEAKIKAEIDARGDVAPSFMLNNQLVRMGESVVDDKGAEYYVGEIRENAVSLSEGGGFKSIWFTKDPVDKSVWVNEKSGLRLVKRVQLAFRFNNPRPDVEQLFLDEMQKKGYKVELKDAQTLDVTKAGVTSKIFDNGSEFKITIKDKGRSEVYFHDTVDVFHIVEMVDTEIQNIYEANRQLGDSPVSEGVDKALLSPYQNTIYGLWVNNRDKINKSFTDRFGQGYVIKAKMIDWGASKAVEIEIFENVVFSNKQQLVVKSNVTIEDERVISGGTTDSAREMSSHLASLLMQFYKSHLTGDTPKKSPNPEKPVVETKKVSEIDKVIEGMEELGLIDNLTKEEEEIAAAFSGAVIKKSSDNFIGYNYKNQHELNEGIRQFLEAFPNKNYTDEELKFIAKYEGSGGLIKQGAEGKGVLHEYYTPELLVQKMWALATSFGFKGGKILEPSIGTGNFLRNVNFMNSTVTGYEISPVSSKIVSSVYPGAKIIQGSFANHFYGKTKYTKNTPDPDFEKDFDLVIGNPPYGDPQIEEKWSQETKLLKLKEMRFEHYFMIRGLDCLKPGGLLVYVTTNNFFTKGYEKAKEAVSNRANLLDAYMLPDKTFKTTQVGTAIIVLRKK